MYAQPVAVAWDAMEDVRGEMTAIRRSPGERADSLLEDRDGDGVTNTDGIRERIWRFPNG